MILELITSGKRIKNLFISLRGQSNAQGSSTGLPVESYLNQDIPRNYIWNGSSLEQLNLSTCLGNDHGCELNLGYLLSQYFPNINIYWVKHVWPGSPLFNEATRRNWSIEANDLHAGAISRINGCTNYLNSNSIPFTYISDIWIQYERDARFEDASNNYKTNWDATYADFLSRLNVNPNYILMNIPSNVQSGMAYKNVVKALILEIISENSEILGLDMDNLPINDDNLHFTSAGQNTIGQRCFDVIKPLT